ncbi:polyprenyl synthetase family protein [Clostridium sp. JN-9]|uniref:polyprenyl synthetase family protein n=1 Tax=Clostridium sp. JN-9 TaxID=2507159 RepID=UPI000FFE0492|nr:farnesyl diphosphate synthase [Clostridium sp. JN-9]QAT40060.1 polyprenyl synthetase family protein [Clostridium sp. JN-9]
MNKDNCSTIELLKNEIDEWCRIYFINKGSYDSILFKAMNYSLNAGGKRIRPMLLLLGYMLYKKDYHTVIDAAGALEMIQTYSLIHDDLPCMDNDDLRRGKPTNHKVYGEALALLAGDGLLNEAMNILFNLSSKIGPDCVKAASIISNASGPSGMIGGQVVDILAENKTIDIEELTYMHKKKTGALIKASIVAGSVLGGASEEDLNILGLYGESLGLAFQIKDDILDVTGESSKLGKDTKADESNNKTTFVSVYGIDECKEMCEKLSYKCIEYLSMIKRDTSILKDLTIKLLNRVS